MASMTSQLAALILPLRSLFEPLLDRISSLEALEYLFYRYGWRVTLDDTAFAAISDALRAKTALEDLIAIAGPLQQKLDTDAALTGDDVAVAGAGARRARAGRRSFRGGGHGGPAAAAERRRILAEHRRTSLRRSPRRVPAHLSPGIYLVLHAAGVIDYRFTAADGAFRQPYTRIVFDWRQIGALIEDPDRRAEEDLSVGPAGQAVRSRARDRRGGTGTACDALAGRSTAARRRRCAAAGDLAVSRPGRRRRAADHADQRRARERSRALRARTGAAARREADPAGRVGDDPHARGARRRRGQHSVRRAAADMEGRAQSRQRAGRGGVPRHRRPRGRTAGARRERRDLAIHARRRRTSSATRRPRDWKSAIPRFGSPSRAPPTIRKCACGSAPAARTVSRARASSCRWTRPTVS